jgi:hypothetical protein
MAWQYISSEVTVKGFKKCCISSAVDGTNGMLWNDHEEDVGVRTECDKGEGTDCEDGNSDTDG